MNHEQIQEKIDLTAEQALAWENLKRAFNRCYKTNITFYQMLNTLIPLNGNNIKSVGICEGVDDPDLKPTSYMTDNYNKAPECFADDEGMHFLIFK